MTVCINVPARQICVLLLHLLLLQLWHERSVLIDVDAHFVSCSPMCVCVCVGMSMRIHAYVAYHNSCGEIHINIYTHSHLPFIDITLSY